MIRSEYPGDLFHSGPEGRKEGERKGKKRKEKETTAVPPMRRQVLRTAICGARGDEVT